MRGAWLMVLVTILARAEVARPAERGPTRPPNVIFLLADDLARWGLGSSGNTEASTPHLHRLALEGAFFRHAFVNTPVCSPSRATLFSGRYPTRLEIEDWIDPTKEPDVGLAPSVIGWPEVLRQRGYATALLGKWHLGTRERFHPTRQGYDLFYGFLGGGNRSIDPRLEDQGVERTVPGSFPDLLVDRATRFLEEKRDAPFLLSIHFREPHAPYAPTPEEDRRPFASLDPAVPDVEGLPAQKVKDLRKQYYASVHSIDRNVGRLLAKLDELGLSDNTLVVFTSDNGYMIGQHGLWHKGNASWMVEGRAGHRPNMFEESIGVPLIMRWPGVIPRGLRPEIVVSHVDIFPTLLDLLGIAGAENLELDGRSNAPWLRGAEQPERDDTLFGQYDMHHYTRARMRMIRTPDWKLIRHFEEGGRDELYDLRADPGERENLAERPGAREARNRLESSLSAWMRSIDDPLLAAPSQR